MITSLQNRKIPKNLARVSPVYNATVEKQPSTIYDASINAVILQPLASQKITVHLKIYADLISSIINMKQVPIFVLTFYKLYKSSFIMAEQSFM